MKPRDIAIPAGDAGRLGVFGLLLILAGGAGQVGANAEPAPRSPVEERLGIKIEGMHLSAAGYIVDCRYRVLDPVKAAPLLDRKVNPYLLDEATGMQLGVPDAPKVGKLRPTSRGKIIAGRNYYILFANPGRHLKSGSKVTLVAGDNRIADIAID